MNQNNTIQNINSSAFTTRAHELFTAIFSYHFHRNPSLSNRQTPFGTYASLTFRKSRNSPLLRLLAEELIGEFHTIEILLKNSPNQKIDDTDLESVILSVRKEKETLFILVAKEDMVPPDDYDRLFRFFTRHQVIILPLGENDIVKLEKFVQDGNINACLVILCLLVDRITTDPWDEQMLKRYGGVYAFRNQWQKEATSSRLDKIAKIKGKQSRTLIKKFRFLMNLEKEGNEIAKTCKAIKISRKTFYLWLEKDAAFRELMHTK